MALGQKTGVAPRTPLPAPVFTGKGPSAAAAAAVTVAMALSLASAVVRYFLSTSPIVYGTLDTQASTAATEARAGVTMAMLELSWASFEPQEGAVSASYVTVMKSELAAYRAAGMKVTLGLGMAATPSWVFSLPDSTYTDQDGNTSGEADVVFSQAVRHTRTPSRARSSLRLGRGGASGKPAQVSGSGSARARRSRCRDLPASEPSAVW